MTSVKRKYSDSGRDPSSNVHGLIKHRQLGRRPIGLGILIALVLLPGLTILAWGKPTSWWGGLGHGITAGLGSIAAVQYSYERAANFRLTGPDAVLLITMVALLGALVVHSSTLKSVASGANVVFTLVAFYGAPRLGVLRRTASDSFHDLLPVIALLAPLYAVFSIVLSFAGANIELFYKEGWIFKGAFRNPNTFATLALTGGVTSTVLLLRRRTMGACLLLLNCALIVATGARGCMFAFTIFLVLVLLYQRPLVITVGLLGVTMLFTSGVLYFRLEDLDFASKLGLIETLQVRYEIWQEIAVRVRASPLVGHGTGSDAMYVYLQGREDARGAHSGILATALRYGLPACLLYLGFVAAWAYHVWARASRLYISRRTEVRVLVIGVLAVTSQALIRDSFILPSSLNISAASVLALMGAGVWQIRPRKVRVN